MKIVRSMVLTLTLIGGPALAADRTETVRFPPGKSFTTVSGSVRGYDGVIYSIAARQGMAMQLLFAPANRSCYFNVYAPGKDIGDGADFIGSTQGNEFSVGPTEAGTYKAQVYLMRNAARRKETCRFKLSIELTGAPGGAGARATSSPGASVSDRLMFDICKASAAPMYGVQAGKITLAREIVSAGGGFQIDGVVDKGPEGQKKLRCIFNAQRRFSHIQAMTSDGE